MQIKTITIVASLLGLVSFTTSAAEMKVVNSIQGRAGMHTVVRAAVEHPTVALSTQGQGVGKRVEEERPVKAQWYNPSRQLVGASAGPERD